MLTWLLQILGYLAPFMLVLSVLVFFHELGHYLVARYNKVRVEVFSIGFGPEVFGWNDRVGTRWKVSWLPFGGYVKMWGDENAASVPDHKALKEMPEEDRSGSLHAKTVWQRMAVCAAGPFANYFLAFVLFAALFMVEGYRYADTNPVIGRVVAGGPAFKAGFQPQDRILKADDTLIERFEDIVHYVRSRVSKPIIFQVERAGQTLTLSAVPEAALPGLFSPEESTSGRLGIYGGEVVVGRQNPFQAIGLAAKELFVISWQMLHEVFQMLMGQRSMDDMGGPLVIAQLSGEIAQSGWAALLWVIALLSINLGLINLFPVPLLDGGHLFLYGIEAIRGKPLSEKALEWCYRLGLGVVLCLLLLTTWNDLHRLKVFQFLGTLLGV